jgi:transposase-like protein
VAHPGARLNVLGRELLVIPVEVPGWPVATAAQAQGISRATGYKWVRRFRAEGAPGLADRSFRPHHSPRATPAAEVARILAARSEWRWVPIVLDRCSAIQRPRSPPSSSARVCRAWPTLTGRRGCRSAAVKRAIRARSSTRTTRSSAGSLTGAAIGFVAARPSCTAGTVTL